ncbi:replication-relaxation family protein (plasmid) [Bacillus carboniphilus]|uniref:Replication-relaxation family protein n=1 Tax=Bacillus carboniphilus TaxID=86663 RepID=A0ABY9K3S8_9BACI|nr:replication-relaxation family protein [Bacillus carboniphilus]WLR44450.1 replication-relaxation family protein [Bacillus carboniphilus]
MRKRDLNILDDLERFRCLTAEQIGRIHFSHTKNSYTNASFVVKRLRDRDYIDCNTDRRRFVYFPKSSRIKKNGQKIDHFLAIADFYIDLKRAKGLRFYHVEPSYMDIVRPDACMIWRQTAFFVEIQKSHYSTKVMDEKMKRYQKYYESGQWRELHFQNKDKARFPRIWIVANHQYKINIDSRIKVIQCSSVKSLLSRLEK